MGAGNGGRRRQPQTPPQQPVNVNPGSVGGYTIPSTNPLAYVRSQKIGLQINGMIPNTRLSLFCDAINITKLCAPATPITNINSITLDTEFQDSGNIGDAIITNANGSAFAVFHIPENIFQIGTKNISIFNYTTDTDAYQSKYSNNSCHAFSTFSVADTDQNDLTDPVVFSTAPPSYGCAANTTSGRTGGAIDYSTQPLCQSFYIGSDMADGQDGIYINSVDLYFSKKSNTQPVSIEIRTMSNDMPTQTILPYSTVSRSAASVLVAPSAEASSSFATKFNFERPVFLKAGYYYAIAVNPGGQTPDYSVWTATTGKTTTAGTVNNSWGQGKLYKSTTNGSTWTSIPNQFLKFNVNRVQYNSEFLSNGQVKIVNGDYEFISFINPSNIGFIVGEYVYQQPTAHISICSVSTTSNTLAINTTAYGSLTTINSAPLNDFAVGDQVVVCGSFPAVDQDGFGRFNYNLFGNAVSLKVLSVHPSGLNLEFGYSNGALITGTPWSNGALHIYKSQPGHVTYNPSSKTIVGIGTKFDINQNTNEADQTDKRPLVVHTGNTTVATYEVLWPSAVVNSTSISSKNSPLKTIPAGRQAIPITAPVGRISDIDYTRNLIILDKSTANAASGAASAANVYATPTFFAPGRTLVGTKSGATAIVSAVHNIVVNSVQPVLQTSTPQGTSISYTANVTASDYNSIDYPNYSAGITNYFTNNQIIIASRSNEVLKMSGRKSFIINATLSSNSTVLSPTIDLIGGASLLAKTNIIGSSSVGEHKNNGNAKSKYVSQVVTLSEENDAEDLNVYLTAYKPLGTNIIVFAKLLNASDNELLEDKDWSVLRQVTDETLYSDSINQDDYKEYLYSLPTNPTAVPFQNLITTNGTTTITATNADTAWLSVFTTGQLITLYSDIYGSNFEVNKIVTVNSDTSITLANPVGLPNGTSGIVAAMPFPYSAFKNSNNGNIVRYYNTNGSAYDSFRKFAIKIVFAAQDNNLVPKVADIRALALSV